ncbi:ATP-binding protein [Actinoplanes sp. HUAS TT8]|uniref:sensor histidine kinase n=1 Tax=Actinoplanes sp. HUAS TT8 TaxID=3447453 RepID=UPI003F5221E0
MLRLLRKRLGVRMRSALAAGIVVVLASVFAGAILLFTARGILLDNVNSAASDRTAQVTAALTAQNAAALDVALRSSKAGRSLVQVVTQDGQVVGASTAIADLPAMSGLRPAVGRREQESKNLPVGEGEPWRVVATGVNTADGKRIVLVAESMDAVSDSTEAILVALLLGLPVLALMVGVATFYFVGRTLLPVEAMRRRAATITATNLHARLPLPEADDEIAALATTMNTMLDRIEASAAAQRRFVGDASHELRSPLTTIRANADLLAGTDRSPSVRRIQSESARMSRLVEDLLLLARVDDQPVPARREDVDLDDLVFAERERISVEHPHLRVEGGVSPVRVTGDRDQLTRVLRNLVDNTVRHARERVTVSLTGRDGQGEIVVGNDGPPIPRADRERIFDRFVRLDDSRSRDGGGSGLGLAIARDIITTHQGTLTVDDLSEGAAMRLRLPASPE